MGKTKAVANESSCRRRSVRLANTAKPSVEPKPKKPATKKASKAKKAKLSENGSAKAEEPKAEATEDN